MDRCAHAYAAHVRTCVYIAMCIRARGIGELSAKERKRSGAEMHARCIRDVDQSPAGRSAVMRPRAGRVGSRELKHKKEKRNAPVFENGNRDSREIEAANCCGLRRERGGEESAARFFDYDPEGSILRWTRADSTRAHATKFTVNRMREGTARAMKYGKSGRAASIAVSRATL